MNQPILSALQFAVLDAIGAARLKGSDLRESLRKNGFLKSGPAFYQLMARLEESRFISAETESTPMQGFTLKERFYRLTGEGHKALRDTLAFYQSSALASAFAT